jgi:hypothetical protein
MNFHSFGRELISWTGRIRCDCEDQFRGLNHVSLLFKGNVSESKPDQLMVCAWIKSRVIQGRNAMALPCILKFRAPPIESEIEWLPSFNERCGTQRRWRALNRKDFVKWRWSVSDLARFHTFERIFIDWMFMEVGVELGVWTVDLETKGTHIQSDWAA